MPSRRDFLAFCITGLAGGFARSAQAVSLPPPTGEKAAPGHKLETAILAGGCFWGVEGVFQHVRGVRSVVSGYAGGQAETAHYDMVSTGTTGHAEAVKITFDPAHISYGRLLQIFFAVAHDPTELNRQGPDVGSQYRSAIFATNGEQARIAADYVAQLGKIGVFGGRIVTRIEGAASFYPAEAYHQDFMARNPRHPYILANDVQKIIALRQTFPDLYR